MDKRTSLRHEMSPSGQNNRVFFFVNLCKRSVKKYEYEIDFLIQIINHQLVFKKKKKQHQPQQVSFTELPQITDQLLYFLYGRLKTILRFLKLNFSSVTFQRFLSFSYFKTLQVSLLFFSTRFSAF